MKHTQNCECEICSAKLYSRGYITENSINEVDSIEYISGNWYVNYSIYDLTHKLIKSTQWPISTWNKYAKINIGKYPQWTIE